ncbi:MAG: BatA domain-containing protein, partial [Gemmobacter sp.]|nr:BatA domain-containing protein [Gemmobacter sp.]
MWTLGPVGFASPLLLLGLAALPLLWLLLRAVPPAPLRRRFPGVALLIGLKDEDVETDRTPLWLLLLRAAAVGAAIIAFAGPVLHPVASGAAGDDPLLIVIDGGWADARDWPRRVARATDLVEAAGRTGRTVAVIRLTDRPEAPMFQTGDAVGARLAGLQPQPWAPMALADWADTLSALSAPRIESWWISDGLAHPGRDHLLAALEGKGKVTVVETPRPLLVLKPAVFREGAVQLAALRLPAGGAEEVEVSARGLDPAGIERELGRARLAFDFGEAEAHTALELPPELRNRLTRFEIAGQPSAAAVTLTDDGLKRPKVALLAAAAPAEGMALLSPEHYLRQALAPMSDLMEGGLADLMRASPDVLVLTDVARLSAAETAELTRWVGKGGIPIRFAGPRLAAAATPQGGEDPLLPVRLRAGGRALGGAMSWGDPRTLAPFAPESPFFGLAIPAEVTVSEQVLADPDPDLAARSIAALADGTPLVTRKALGDGQVVLFHVTANAEWSSLPLSGLF